MSESDSSDDRSVAGERDGKFSSISRLFVLHGIVMLVAFFVFVLFFDFALVAIGGGLPLTRYVGTMAAVAMYVLSIGLGSVATASLGTAVLDVARANLKPMRGRLVGYLLLLHAALAGVAIAALILFAWAAMGSDLGRSRTALQVLTGSWVLAAAALFAALLFQPSDSFAQGAQPPGDQPFQLTLPRIYAILNAIGVIAFASGPILGLVAADAVVAFAPLVLAGALLALLVAPIAEIGAFATLTSQGRGGPTQPSRP